MHGAAKNANSSLFYTPRLSLNQWVIFKDLQDTLQPTKESFWHSEAQVIYKTGSLTFQLTKLTILGVMDAKFIMVFILLGD